MPRKKPAPLVAYEELLDRYHSALAALTQLEYGITPRRHVILTGITEPDAPLQTAPLDAPDARVNPDCTIRGTA